jgi:hypothetical protein
MYNRLFQINLWRFSVNVAWWNENVMVPLAHMPYQQWIAQVISWMEQAGSYVEVTKGPQFDEPPCGRAGSFCTSQNTGLLELEHQAIPGDPDPSDPDAYKETSDGRYMGPAYQFWQSFSAQYRYDPAIIYDSWNEWHALSRSNPAQWWANEERMIKIIRANAPGALIVLSVSSDDMQAGLHYHQGNLAYDYHIYPGSPYTLNWPFTVNRILAYAHNDGNAVMFNEWGGTYDHNPYSNDLVAYAVRNGVGIAFYTAGTMLSHKRLNAIGMLVQAEYASIPANPQGGASRR